MNTPLKWLIGLVIALGIIAGLTFAFVAGRAELALEREREAPVKSPTRTHRNAQGENVITLDAETRARVGITVTPLVAATRTPEIQAFGVVLDPAPIVDVYSELVAAEAALINSTAQLTRTKALFADDQNASRRALDASEAQHSTDAAKLLSAQQHWTQALGDAGAMNATDREQFAAKLAQRKTVLMRVEVAPGEPPVKPSNARVIQSGEEEPFTTVRAIYSAPSIAGHILGQAFLLVAESSDARLRPGVAITVYLSLPGDKQNGVTLPRSSVVRASGLAWAYVQSGVDEFTRRLAATTAPSNDGWFVSGSFEPSEPIVVTGAQTLLSEEFKSQISVGEESNKE